MVRLINSGFGSGDEWDAQYDATEAGWRLFLYNLRLYLTHFPGQPCASILVNGIRRPGAPGLWRARGDLGLAREMGSVTG